MPLFIFPSSPSFLLPHDLDSALRLPRRPPAPSLILCPLARRRYTRDRDTRNSITVLIRVAFGETGTDVLKRFDQLSRGRLSGFSVKRERIFHRTSLRFRSDRRSAYILYMYILYMYMCSTEKCSRYTITRCGVRRARNGRSFSCPLQGTADDRADR